jgi:cytochrome c-type biogenesis protein
VAPATLGAWVAAWYGWLSSLSQGAVLALQSAAAQVELPVVTVVILGLIAATSPCQLSTNLAALAYASSAPASGRSLGLAAAYVAGKISVYTVLGGVAGVVGLQFQAAAIPAAVAARKALGPLMILVGLGLLGVVPIRLTRTHHAALEARRFLPASGASRAYLLGVAFSFAFCPTLFWLFFGLTVPLAIQSAGGWSFPALFAVGSSLPLLAVTALVAAGIASASTVTGRMARLERPVRVVAAVVLVVAGLHDTVVYWAL